MILLKEKNNVVYAIAEGKLRDEDYDRMLPLLRKKVEEYGSVRWYFQMKNFEGWTFNTFWRDIQFDFKNNDKIEKVAMVGESKWHEAMTEVMKLFAKAEVRYFREEDSDEALGWIEE